MMSPGNGDIIIKTDKYIGEVSSEYLSIAVDTDFLRKGNIFNITGNSKLQAMVRALHPAFLRIGGNAADLLIFVENSHSEEQNYLKSYENDLIQSNFHQENHVSENQVCPSTNPPSTIYLSGKEWLALNELANRTQNSLLFDLNVLLRNEEGEWDSTNAQQLLNFSEGHGLRVNWQLGNEPNSFCHRFGFSIPPKQLGKDFKSLSALLSNYVFYNNSKIVGPDVTRPLFSEPYETESTAYLRHFLVEAGSVLSAVAWHQYYLNGRIATASSFLDPNVLNVLPKQIKIMRDIVARSMKRPVPMWISETSSAYGGGAQGLSDRFIAGFMWLDKLGLAATFNVSVVIRQSLLGGNYGLIDHHSLQPNPDFWVSVLYKKLVGRRVLLLAIDEKDPKVRLYAHCATKESAGHRPHTIVLFGMNLGDSSVTKQIVGSDSLELYILTPPNKKSLLSKAIHLNGRLLSLTPSGDIPTMDPLIVKDKTIQFPAYSMVFAVVHGLVSPACMMQYM